mgnify:CR=1 FL=1
MLFRSNTPMVGVFDTAFHQTMPKEAFIYGLPYEAYTDNMVRRYGFHGTSHNYVTLRAIEMLGKPAEETKIITCHLGNGSSISAVKGGKCIDTSMGLTPLEGVPMGTRCGDMDPAIVIYRKHWWNGHPLAVLRLTEDWWCRYALMCGSERELIIALPESFPELYDPDQLLTVRLSERMRK